MKDEDFHDAQIALFVAFSEQLNTLAQAPGGEPLTELAAGFSALASTPDRIMDEAPPLVSRMLTTAPQLTERFPRDLLWYLGGECLHFMPDEEIDRLRELDEQRREAGRRGQVFDWKASRASALKLQ